MYLYPETSRVPALEALWQTVFGDEKDYTDLFFGGVWKNSHTLIAEENGEIVSALYLLQSLLRADGEVFRGFYLYAAATAPACRRRGHMGRLIEEAKAFCTANGGDFIALLPANAPLYDYYAAFGFGPVLSICSGTIACEDASLRPVSMDRYAEAYRNASFDRFFWEGEELDYALSCLSYCGFSAFEGKSGMLLSNGESVKEVLAETEEAAAETLRQSGVHGPAEGPYLLPGFQKNRFGMAWTQNSRLSAALQKTEPYMNLALD